MNVEKLRRSKVTSWLAVALIASMLIAPLLLPTPVLASTTTVYSTKDTYIEEFDMEERHGDEGGFCVGGKSSTNTRTRALVHFTLPELPGGSVITSAQLKLYYVSSEGGSTTGRLIQAYGLRTGRNGWDDSLATGACWYWWSYPNYWTTYGCGSSSSDFTTTGGVSAMVPSVAGYMTWTVTDLIQYAYSQGYSQQGFRLHDIGEDSDAITVWWTKEKGTLTPHLIVNYESAPSPIDPPTVTTTAATSIGTSGATLQAYLADDGGESCSVRFQYGLTTSYGTTTAWVSGYVTGNTITKAITGLAPGTTYHFRAQASNSAGTTSGSDQQFSTLPYAPYNFVATPGNTQIVLTWDKGDGASYTMVRRSTSGYPTSPTSGTEVYFNSGTTKTDTGLTNGIKQYYSAWSYANGAYSSTKATDSETPVAPGPPGCTTNAATNVDTDSARLNMYLDTLNGAASANVSFQWYKAGDPEWGNSTTPAEYYVPGTHYADLAGLAVTTTYYFRARAVSAYGTGYGASKSFTTGGYSAPTMTTQAATGVMRAAATINGKVTSDGDDPAGCTVWFQWGLSAVSLNQETESISGLITNDTFYYGLTGLTATTTYYFRAVGENSEGLSYGTVLNFTTTTAPTPTVRTDNAVTGANQAMLYGTLLTDGGSTCGVWFEWGETGAYGHNTSSMLGYTAGQAFSTLIIGLEIDTLYHYRTHATNEGGAANGADGNFTTIFAAPGNFRAKAISGTTINLEWVKGGDQTLIRYKAGNYPIDRADGTQCYFGPATSASLSNLEPGSSYYFRAWSWREGNVWSSDYADDMATTLSGTIPGTEEPIIIPPTPTTPSRWFSLPTGEALQDMPLYDFALGFADSLSMPHGTFWMIIGNLAVVVAGALVWKVTKKASVGIIVAAFVSIVCGFLTLLPLMVMVVYIAFAGGVTFVSQRT